MAKLRVEVVTAERAVLTEEDVDMVIAPGSEGVIGILPRHAPLMTGVLPGEMVLKRGNDEQYLAVSGGFLQVANDRVLILADTAERADEIDEQRAAEARAQAEQALKQAGPAGAVQTEAARTALRLSLARLNVAQRRRRRTSM